MNSDGSQQIRPTRWIVVYLHVALCTSEEMLGLSSQLQAHSPHFRLCLSRFRRNSCTCPMPRRRCSPGATLAQSGGQQEQYLCLDSCICSFCTCRGRHMCRNYQYCRNTWDPSSSEGRREARSWRLEILRMSVALEDLIKELRFLRPFCSVYHRSLRDIPFLLLPSCSSSPTTSSSCVPPIIRCFLPFSTAQLPSSQSIRGGGRRQAEDQEENGSALAIYRLHISKCFLSLASYPALQAPEPQLPRRAVMLLFPSRGKPSPSDGLQHQLASFS